MLVNILKVCNRFVLLIDSFWNQFKLPVFYFYSDGSMQLLWQLVHVIVIRIRCFCFYTALPAAKAPTNAKTADSGDRPPIVQPQQTLEIALLVY